MRVLGAERDRCSNQTREPPNRRSRGTSPAPDLHAEHPAGEHADRSYPERQDEQGRDTELERDCSDRGPPHATRAVFYSSVRAESTTFIGSCFSSTTTRCRGPCTPSTRFSSMSEVAEGPEIRVTGARRSRTAEPSRANASGTSTTTCSGS